jgi:two-component system chemotaxis response regulator CheB
MSSTLTRRNAEVSLRALSLGATDYIPKPESNRELSGSASFRRELIEKIRALGARHKQRLAPSWESPAARPRPPGHQAAGAGLRVVPSPATAPESVTFKLRPLPSVPPRILLIGSSTGGPQALGAIVGRISGVIDQAPVLITQHMPPTFTTILAEILERGSGRPVH